MNMYERLGELWEANTHRVQPGEGGQFLIFPTATLLRYSNVGWSWFELRMASQTVGITIMDDEDSQMSDAERAVVGLFLHLSGF